MGIKDNFSQAVKELWKKDGLDENGENQAARDGQPTELDKYLAKQDAEAAAMSQQVPPAQPNVQMNQQMQQGQYVQQPQYNQPMQGAAPMQDYGMNQQGDVNAAGVPLETPYYRQEPINEQPNMQQNVQPNMQQNVQPNMQQNVQMNQQPQQMPDPAQGYGAGGVNNAYGGMNGGYGGGYVPPAQTGGNAGRAASETDEVTVISKNTVIDGNVRSLANMQLDGNIKGNVETTRNIEMSGKVVGDIKCNNANMNSAAMQGNVTLKGKMRMDRDTILIGDLTSQLADVNGRIRGKLDIAGKAELKRDAIVFGDINASTIAVTDGAIIQGYVNTTFLSKEDSRNAIPDAISFDAAKSGE